MGSLEMQRDIEELGKILVKATGGECAPIQCGKRVSFRPLMGVEPGSMIPDGFEPTEFVYSLGVEHSCLLEKAPDEITDVRKYGNTFIIHYRDRKVSIGGVHSWKLTVESVKKAEPDAGISERS